MNRRIEYYHSSNAPVATSLVVSTSVCAFDEKGSLLLIRRTDSDDLCLPGGVQQVGETVAHAAEREAKEETGINVSVTEIIGIFSDPDYVIQYPDGSVGQEFSICFRGYPYGGMARNSVESSSVHWVQPDDLAEIDLGPGIRLRVEQAINKNDRVYFT